MSVIHLLHMVDRDKDNGHIFWYIFSVCTETLSNIDMKSHAFYDLLLKKLKNWKVHNETRKETLEASHVYQPLLWPLTVPLGNS